MDAKLKKRLRADAELAIDKALGAITKPEIPRAISITCDQDSRDEMSLEPMHEAVGVVVDLNGDQVAIETREGIEQVRDWLTQYLEATYDQE